MNRKYTVAALDTPDQMGDEYYAMQRERDFLRDRSLAVLVAPKRQSSAAELLTEVVTKIAAVSVPEKRIDINFDEIKGEAPSPELRVKTSMDEIKEATTSDAVDVIDGFAKPLLDWFGENSIEFTFDESDLAYDFEINGESFSVEVDWESKMFNFYDSVAAETPVSYGQMPLYLATWELRKKLDRHRIDYEFSSATELVFEFEGDAFEVSSALGLEDLPTTVEALNGLNEQLFRRLESDLKNLHTVLFQTNLPWFEYAKKEYPRFFHFKYSLPSLPQAVLKRSNLKFSKLISANKCFHSHNPLAVALNFSGSDNVGLIRSFSFRLNSSGQLEAYNLSLNCAVPRIYEPDLELVMPLLNLGKQQSYNLEDKLTASLKDISSAQQRLDFFRTTILQVS